MSQHRQYRSTRGRAPECSFRDTLFAGLAPDGGLYLPVKVEPFTRHELEAIRSWSYVQVAAHVMHPYMRDVSRKDLITILEKAYTLSLFAPGVVPFRVLDRNAKIALLKLSTGPSLSFKDLGMRALFGLLANDLARRNERTIILGATSGDTGSAAEAAAIGLERVAIVMLWPTAGGTTSFQFGQMNAFSKGNVINCLVPGTFDDCQDIVKAVNADTDFKRRYRVGAVNSINWARILAQQVYYVWGWLRATDLFGDMVVEFSVPTGNLGDLYAGFHAMQRELPMRLILATNENDVLVRLFQTGLYDTRRDVIPTSSPSMNITKASNLERMVCDLSDARTTRVLFEQVEKVGRFDISGTDLLTALNESTRAGMSTHEDRTRTICAVWSRCHVMIDPHTADGLVVGKKLRFPGLPLVCLETADPVKFPEVMHEAIGQKAPRRPEDEGIEDLPQTARLLSGTGEVGVREVMGIIESVRFAA